jgi:predicted AlkP superfamily phosphohydrolase/phosphomutase
MIEKLKSDLMTIPHPETGKPLVDRVIEGSAMYDGPHKHLAPDLTVVLGDWKYRTIGLYDFTTHNVISPAFGPTGDHRMEGILIASGPAFQPGASPENATLLDIAPTVLHILGVPVPADMDGRVLTEILEPSLASTVGEASAVSVAAEASDSSGYTAEEDAAIQQSLADLGYL